MASAENLAHEFWSAVRQHDIERAAALLADDAIFQPAGMRPATGREAVECYVAATDKAVDPALETIALYEEMIIVERTDRVPGDPAGLPRDIVSLARVHDGRIVSWQDFFDPAVYAEFGESPRAGSKRAAAR